MARLGCLLIILAMGAMAALVVLPVIGPFRDNSLLMSIQAAINCPPGYTFENEFTTYRPTPGETVESATGYCISPDGEREQISEEAQLRYFGIAAGSFVIPFLIGLFMFNIGVSRGVKKRVASLANGQMIAQYNPYTGKNTLSTTDGRVSVTGLDPKTTDMIQRMTGIDVSQMSPGQVQVTTMSTQIDDLPPSARFAVDQPGSGESLTVRLKQLEEAKNAGLITQEEYDQKRREILDSM